MANTIDIAYNGKSKLKSFTSGTPSVVKIIDDAGGNSKTISAIGAGTSKLTFTFESTSKPVVTTTKTINVTVKQRETTPFTITPDITDTTNGYNNIRMGTPLVLTFNTAGTITAANITNTNIATYNSATKTITPVAIGTTTFTITAKETDKLAKTITATINVIEAFTAPTITFNGTEVVDGGTINLTTDDTMTVTIS